MENATDALKMAAAVLIFVGALSLAMMSLTKAKQASQSLITTDEVSCYSYKSSFSNVNFSSVREVGIDTVIPNIYSYYQNFNTILFYTASDSTLSDIKPMVLYYTEALDYSNDGSTTQLDKSILRAAKVENSGISDGKAIYGLDINDERAREEPWANDSRFYKLFLDSLINCVDSPYYTWSRNERISNHNNLGNHQISIKFTYGNTAYKWKNFATNNKGRFIERIGRYNYKAIYEANKSQNYDEISSRNLVAVNNADSQIVFDNGEAIDNEKDTEKMVIQYIYIGQK